MKMWRIATVGGVLALVLGTASTAYAQDETPVTPYAPGTGRGWMGWQRGTGFLHEYMIAAFAEALGLKPEVLESRLASGDTIADVASEQGLNQEGFRALWLKARSQATQAAVADGLITAEQADWMTRRMQVAGSNGDCTQWGGSGAVGRGPHGRGGVQTRGLPPSQP